MNRSPLNTSVLPAFSSSLVIWDNSLTAVIVPLLIVAFALCVAMKCLYGQRRAFKRALVGDAVCRQLFDVWSLSILVLGVDEKTERINKLLLEELQLDLKQVAGRQAVETIELIQDKENLLPRSLKEIQSGKRNILLSTNYFIREPRFNISFLIQGGIAGTYESGRLIKIIVYLRNVPKERTQRHVLNIALSKTHIFSWSLDMERNLMAIDPHYSGYLKIPTRDHTLTMEQFSDLVHSNDRRALFDALAGQLTGNLYKAPAPYRLRRGDEGWEQFEGRSTHVGQLPDLPLRIVGTCMSAQRHKDTKDRLNDALQKVQRSDQLKSVFLANMGHETRTPLNAIVDFSTLLVSEQSDSRPKDIGEYVALIEKNGQLLMLLTSDILGLSKIESNTMEFNASVLSLNETFIGVACIQRLNVEPGIELIADLSVEDVPIIADPVGLEQVVNNLINNAIKFTSRGSIRIGYRRRGEKDVELFVEDTGKGISEEIIAHVFERFHKGDSSAQGTGLGPAICKTTVEHPGGEIRAESEVGERARPKVCLSIGRKQKRGAPE